MSDAALKLLFVGKMNLEMDADVRTVLEFMQSNLSAHKLVGISTEVARLAPALWGHFPAEEVRGLRLDFPQIIGCASPRSGATESADKAGAAHGSEPAAGVDVPT